MKLSWFTDYALRSLMYLVTAQRRCSIQEIADFYGISKPHVAKVIVRLVKLGLVRSVRGVGGGVELGQSAAEIRIGAVVEALEGDLRLLDCVGSEQLVCVIQPGCKLRSVLAHAQQLQRDYLQSVRLSDVVSTGVELVSLTEEDRQ